MIPIALWGEAWPGFRSHFGSGLARPTARTTARTCTSCHGCPLAAHRCRVASAGLSPAPAQPPAFWGGSRCPLAGAVTCNIAAHSVEQMEASWHTASAEGLLWHQLPSSAPLEKSACWSVGSVPYRSSWKFGRPAGESRQRRIPSVLGHRTVLEPLTYQHLRAVLRTFGTCWAWLGFVSTPPPSLVRLAQRSSVDGEE